MTTTTRPAPPTPAPPKDRVTVLIDYENVARTADRAFLTGAREAHILPRATADLIVRRRRRPSRLHEVRVYRGQPNPHHQSPCARVVRRNPWYPLSPVGRERRKHGPIYPSKGCDRCRYHRYQHRFRG